ncbi:MAG: hypothetical protein ABL949_13595 [Fimbriimonadaceae bacterium]
MSKTSGETSGELVRQRHGGALLKGGVPGHQGGGGRPPSMVRAALLAKGWDALPEIEGIMKGESSTGQVVSPAQQVAAWKAMMELSLPKITEQFTATVDAVEIMKVMGTVLERYLPRNQIADVIREIGEQVKSGHGSGD